MTRSRLPHPNLATAIAIIAMAIALGWAPAPAGAATQTFTYTGTEQTFIVPAGVASVNVLAVGGTGGSVPKGGTGGSPGAASATLIVTPGQVLYLEVGGNGEAGGGGGSAGGFNGGGPGGPENGGGGGGGASDVRSSPRSAGLSSDRRLLVAPGGGGGGATDALSSGGAGGAAETAGSPDSTNSNAGGGGATAGGGGAGGTVGCQPFYGTGGQLGLGGAGGGGSLPYHASGAGGGGAGYYGGGGGASGCSSGSGGGGGGSFLVPAGGSRFVALAQSPQIQITYTPGSGAGGGAGAGGTVPVLPAISALSQTHPVFKVGATTTPLQGRTSRSVPRGTTFAFRLNQPATVTVRIDRKLPGRRVGGVCKSPTSRLRSRPGCTRLVNKATLRRSARAGLNRIALSGRIRGRALPAGAYRAAFTAASAAGTSPPRALSFRVAAR